MPLTVRGYKQVATSYAPNSCSYNYVHNNHVCLITRVYGTVTAISNSDSQNTSLFHKLLLPS